VSLRSNTTASTSVGAFFVELDVIGVRGESQIFAKQKQLRCIQFSGNLRVFISFTNEEPMSNNNSPEKTFRLGNVAATVWCNEAQGEKGTRTFRTVQLEQRYKEGDQWKSSNRFTFDQLLRLRVCVESAVDYIGKLEMDS
jgi:hypothetical protein